MIKGSIGTQIADRRPGGHRDRSRRPAPAPRCVGRTDAAPHRRRRSTARVAAAPSSAAAKQYTIGYSNGGGVGNGFREEQLCTAKAEALVVGPGLQDHRDPAATRTPPGSSRTSAT